MLAQALEDEFVMLRLRTGASRLSRRMWLRCVWGAGEDVVREWERKAEGVRGRKVDVQEVEGDEE
jgi:hypothetical protein